MITRLNAPERQRVFDGEIGRFIEAEAIPCHRCGVCCERWQPLVSVAEQARLAASLELTLLAFQARYTTPYPFDDTARLLQREGSGCVFLRWDADGRSACAVHSARPDACRDWTASLLRRECLDGLRRMGPATEPLSLTTLYPDAAERAVLLGVIAGEQERHDVD